MPTAVDYTLSHTPYSPIPMTQEQPDRLDRIEATLERVSQQLDNQVVVNAELRQSTTELRQSTTQLTQSVNEIANSVNLLLQTVTIHQQNFEVLAVNMQQMQTSILNLQTENSQILGILQGQGKH